MSLPDFRPRRALAARTLLLPLTAALFSACDLFTGGEDGPRVIDELPRALSSGEVGVRDAGNDFAFRFFGAVLAEEGASGNVFVSPLSASYALGMTLNGAAGQTYQDMAATLGLGGMQLGAINQGYFDLTDLLLGLDPSVSVGIGNSIWYNRQYTIAQPFLQDVRTSFRARVEAAKFPDVRQALRALGHVETDTVDQQKTARGGAPTASAPRAGSRSPAGHSHSAAPYANTRTRASATT